MSKMQRKPPRPPMQLTCDACGKTFMRAPSKYKAKYNFCSEACALGGTWGSCDGPGGARADPDHVLDPGIPGNAACLRTGVSCREIQIRTNRTGYVVEVGGKRVCVRVDECREI